MRRVRYVLANTAVLGIIVLAAVMLYVGVGAFSSAKALVITICLVLVGLFVAGTIADAAMKSPPQGWVKCDEAWVKEHGRAACSTSPKLPIKRTVGQHYHRAA